MKKPVHKFCLRARLHLSEFKYFPIFHKPKIAIIFTLSKVWQQLCRTNILWPKLYWLIHMSITKSSLSRKRFKHGVTLFTYQTKKALVQPGRYLTLFNKALFEIAKLKRTELLFDMCSFAFVFLSVIEFQNLIWSMVMQQIEYLNNLVNNWLTWGVLDLVVLYQLIVTNN